MILGHGEHLMRIGRPASLGAVWTAGLFVSGCGFWLPFGVVEVHKPDPLRKQAARVE